MLKPLNVMDKSYTEKYNWESNYSMGESFIYYSEPFISSHNYV